MIKVTICEKGGEEKEKFFDKDEIMIGRLANNDIVLPKSNISKKHSQIIKRDEKIFIIDLKSTNGTYVNGRRISAPRILDPNDKIFLGDYILRVEECKAGEEVLLKKKEVPLLPKEELKKETIRVDEALTIPHPIPADIVIYNSPDILVDEALTIPPPIPVEVSKPEIEKEEIKPAEEEFGIEIVVEEEKKEEIPEKIIEKISKEVSFPKIISKPKPILLDNKTLQYKEVLESIYKMAEEKIFKNVDLFTLTNEERTKFGQNIIREVENLVKEGKIPSAIDPYEVAQDILYEWAGFGPLEYFLEDEKVQKIFVNDSFSIYIMKDGKKEKVSKIFTALPSLLKTVEKLLSVSGFNLNTSPPNPTGFLSDRIKFAILLPPSGIHEPKIVIEKYPLFDLDFKNLLEREVLNQEMVNFLLSSTKPKKNIIIGGNDGLERLNLVSILSSTFEDSERILLLTRELLPLLKNKEVVFIGSEEIENMRGSYSKIFTSFGFERIIAGDIAEVNLPIFFNSIIAGSKGIIGGAFANNSLDLLERIACSLSLQGLNLNKEEKMSLLRNTIDLIVIIKKFPCEILKVTEIVEIKNKGEELFNPIYEFVEKGFDEKGRVMGEFKKVLQ